MTQIVVKLEEGGKKPEATVTVTEEIAEELPKKKKVTKRNPAVELKNFLKKLKKW